MGKNQIKHVFTIFFFFFFLLLYSTIFDILPRSILYIFFKGILLYVLLHRYFRIEYETTIPFD